MVVATGFFDGVHLGHRLVMQTLLSEARRRGEQSLVITLWPHPRTVLQQDARSLRLLTSLPEKEALLKEAGADKVEVLPFTRDFAAMTAREYLETVVKGRYGAGTIVLGYDNRVGSDSLGPEETERLARSLGLEVVTVPSVDMGGAPVSSTRIRSALAAGDIAAANAMLGYRYTLRGVVVGGKHLGHTIGFATANTRHYEPLKMLPAVGAYITSTRVQGEDFFSMTNIDPDGKTETHIFDFSEDIYGLDIDVSFLEHLRGELHFSSVEELKNQLEKDEIQCKKRILASWKK